MEIAVYGGSTYGDDPAYLEAARALGTWIGREGHTMVFGGSDTGLMGATARAALEAGAAVIGVEPQVLMDRGVPQAPGVELHVVATVAERRALMIEKAQAFVAMAGGPGTLEEISEIMSRIKLGLEAGPCFFLNVGGFWDPVRAQVESMVSRGFLRPEVAEGYRFFSTVEELCCALGRWAEEG